MKKSSFLGGSVSIEKFRKVALDCANLVRDRYYSLIHIYSSEDIVQEVILSCIRYNKVYDPSKKSLLGYVKMLVDQQYYNLLRHHECVKRKESSTSSLNALITDICKEKIELVRTKGEYDTLLDDVSIQGFLSMIRELDDCFNRRDREANLDMHTIIKLKLQGYSHKEIATSLGVRSSYIGDMLRNNHQLILDMFNDYYGSDLDLGFNND